MSTGTGTDTDADSGDSRDRFRFDEGAMGDVDAALRDIAADADDVDECARRASERVEESDLLRLRIRAYQLELFEPDWPTHVDRAAVEEAVGAADTLSEVADDLRLSRQKTKRVLSWVGLADAVDRASMLSVLRRARRGEFEGQVIGDGGDA